MAIGVLGMLSWVGVIVASVTPSDIPWPRAIDKASVEASPNPVFSSLIIEAVIVSPSAWRRTLRCNARLVSARTPRS
jgi:hypothetical protein